MVDSDVRRENELGEGNTELSLCVWNIPAVADAVVVGERSDGAGEWREGKMGEWREGKMGE